MILKPTQKVKCNGKGCTKERVVVFQADSINKELETRKTMAGVHQWSFIKTVILKDLITLDFCPACYHKISTLWEG